MIFIEIGGYGTTNVEYSSGMTANDLTLKIKENENVHFRGDWSLQDTMTGRTLSQDEPVIDCRIYYLNAALERARC